MIYQDSPRAVFLPSEFPYATFANYSPHGTSEISQHSKKICVNIKRGRVGQIELALERLDEPEAKILKPFLNSDVTLVPVPRRAPLASNDALWPAKVIADIFAEHSYGREVVPLLERIKKVQKSSLAPRGERPLYPEHMESMKVVDLDLIKPEQITLIDDVITKGATTFACASLIQIAMPDTKIRIFSLISAEGLVDEIDQIFDPSVGKVRGDEYGQVNRTR